MLTLICFVFAGIFNAFMDIFKIWDSSIFSNLPSNNWFYKWAGSGASWKNKWKLYPNGSLIPNKKALWYYLWMYKPAYKERFMYSTTILVSLTDGWHAFQRAWILMAVSAAVFASAFNMPWDYGWWNIPINIAAFYMAYLIPFNIFYQYILRR